MYKVQSERIVSKAEEAKTASAEGKVKKGLDYGVFKLIITH